MEGSQSMGQGWDLDLQGAWPGMAAMQPNMVQEQELLKCSYQEKGGGRGRVGEGWKWPRLRLLPTFPPTSLSPQHSEPRLDICTISAHTQLNS